MKNALTATNPFSAGNPNGGVVWKITTLKASKKRSVPIGLKYTNLIEG